MSSKPEWNASDYSKYRPTYDPAAFHRIAEYHKPGAFGHALELGCGTGLATERLAPMFDKVTAMDPAPDMLQEAKKKVNLKTRSNQAVEFRQGGAEDLDFLDDASVDLIVAATAAHWFPESWWPGAQRVLVEGGTVALLTYGGYSISTDEQVQPESVQEVNRLTQYLCWDDMYGPTPGTKVVVQLYDAIALPQGSGWSEVNRQKWSFVQRERPLSFDEYWALLMTVSHLRRYKEEHPDFDQPENPMEQTRRHMQQIWPQDKICYVMLPMVIVSLKKTAA